MNNDIQNFSSRERGLLSVASQHKGSVAFYENTVVPHLEATLVKAWKGNALELPVEDIWEYIQEAKWNTYVKIDSAKIGVLTTLEPYTNKKGETKPAHFTHNGTYLGSIKQLGDKPISYVGNFRITKEHFEVYYPANPKRVADFFRPKEIAVCCSEEVPAPKPKKPVLIDDDNDEEPIPFPKPKMKKPTVAKKPVVGDE